MKTYTPKPTNTSDVELSPNLQQLLEDLARNTHEVWAQQRISEGWTWGAERNDEKKHHPDLVAYEELTEGEKEYDRKTAGETLKAITKLGYRIVDPAAQLNNYLAKEAEQVRRKIDSQSGMKGLLAIWHQRSLEIWAANPQLFLHLGEKIRQKSEPLLAYDIFSEGVVALGRLDALRSKVVSTRTLAVKMYQQMALALASCGATSDAINILQRLQVHGEVDCETLGLMGRSWKDRAKKSPDLTDQQEEYRKSFDSYFQGFGLAVASGDDESAYYCGINAASIALILGKYEQSLELSAQVKNICKVSIESQSDGREDIGYWLYATLGEAYLLEKQFEKASVWYSKASAAAARTSNRALGSMRRQARMILRAFQLEETLLDKCFNVPSVVMFSGHMFDRPDRQQRRFPIQNEGVVRERIRLWLDEVNGGVGYASAACGADLIFLEEMLRRGSEIIVVLPFDAVSFRTVCVDNFCENNYGERFEHVLEQATEIRVLGEYNPDTMQGDFMFTNIYLLGRALLRAQHHGAELEALLVWDGNSGDGIGGTASMAEILADCQTPYSVIRPDGSAPIEESSLLKNDQKNEEPIRQSILYNYKTRLQLEGNTAYHHVFLPLLFADVKGYSRLNEDEALRFATFFMGELADVLKKYDKNLLGRRTQGDSLFLVFKEIQACVDCAWELKSTITKADWSEYQLPADLSMRISLDAGPVYSYTDPVTGGMDFCGNYVVRAARLEPVTPPGGIYASETFVAAATAMAVKRMMFEYAGQIELPKRHGRIQAFSVGKY